MKVLGALVKPKGITNHSYKLKKNELLLANKLDFNVDWALNSIFTWALVICVLVMSSSILIKKNFHEV